jgi:hypothetical protein
VLILPTQLANLMSCGNSGASQCLLAKLLEMYYFVMGLEDKIIAITQYLLF